jgi:hypothetical protein
MVAAAALAGGSHGLATQSALIASYTGKGGWGAKAREAATSPGQLLGAAIAFRTATPPGAVRPMPMPARLAAGAHAAPVIAAAELDYP